MKIVGLVIACLLLAGCDTTEQTRAAALEQVKAHCAAEGKTFVYGGTTMTPGLVSYVSVTGGCVAP